MGPPSLPSSATPRRWLGVGHSSDPDARRAGAAAAEQALLHGDAKLIVVFCSDAYDLDAVVGAINHRSRTVPLIGCSTAGEIATSGPGHASVVVIALGGERFSVATSAASGASAVVAAALGSEAPLSIGVRHGWTRVSDPMLVTRSADNRVHTLDDQPALDVYLQRLGAPEDACRDPEAFTRFALTQPLYAQSLRDPGRDVRADRPRARSRARPSREGVAWPACSTTSARSASPTPSSICLSPSPTKSSR